MIIYNVTIQTDKSIASQWLQWMREEDIPELMQTGLFVDAKLFHLLEQDESESVTHVAQYFCNSIDDYNKYISDYATQMREKGLQRFGDKFIAFRTVMEMVA